MRIPFLLLLSLAGCAVPPPEAYVTGSGSREGGDLVDLGRNTVGEACVQAAAPGAGTEIYCGAWQQPSAHVRAAGAADGSGLATLIASGSWRTALDSRYLCGAPRPVSLGEASALQMDCTGRSGGWPYIALAVASNGQGWLADGVVSALPAIAQSVAVLSGRAPAKIVSNAAQLAEQAGRAGEEARATGDSRQYDYLMSQGSRANLVDNPVAAESAYGAALAVQEKALGKDNPNLADPLMHLGLQLSNEGRYAEAGQAFARAAKLAPAQQGDTMLPIRLGYYEALDDLNQGNLPASLAKLQRTEAAYVAAIDPAVLTARPIAPRNSFGADLQNVVSTPADQQNRIALLGLLETKRYEAVVLRDSHQVPESEAKLREANALIRNARLIQPVVTARLRRTSALSAAAAGNGPDALADFGSSTVDFRRAYPGSRPLALVGLLNAQELMRAQRTDEAAEVCRASVQVLIEVKEGYTPERLAPCLDAFAAQAAAASGPARQAVLAQMFLAAQLVRNSKTEQQISQSAARLGAGGSNSAVGQAIRKQQDAAVALAAIRRRQQEAAEAVKAGDPVPLGAAQLAEQEQAALAVRADSERALQAAAPNYGQLVQQVTPAADVLKLLNADEAFLAVTLTADGGWAFLLRGGLIEVAPVKGGTAVIDRLVTRIRATMTPQTPAFDTAASQQLYQLLLGDFGPQLAGVKTLTVVPAGSLLSLPFGILLSGPADPADPAHSPWLIRQMAIGHVPSPGNFVALRQVAGVSHAPNPWFGFGDFQPVTLAQAQRSFGPNCGPSAQELAQIPPLPSAKQELSLAAKLLGAAPGDELLGAAFTVPGVQHTNLAEYKVLHFATHAILPSDLKCQTEPAIVTSAARGAVDASTALLTASDLTQIKLDADLVILSACNSGGADGSGGGGESLSALARSFFYGGARGLLITHWEVNDQVATFIIADTLRRMKAEPGGSVAGALQQAQVDLLDRVGRSVPAEFAHPFYWAPFALIGQAGVPAAATSKL